MDSGLQQPGRTRRRRPELSDDFDHVDDPFSLLDLFNVKPVAGAWWVNPELHRRCVGEAVYFHGAPAAIWARFHQLVDRKLAAEMLQLAGRCQIICEALPQGWAIRPRW
jgi:hypothetical protein